MKLMICDDHQLFRETLASALGRRGHDVVATAPNPACAVESPSQVDVDLCIIVLQFPDASGVDGTRRVRKASRPTRVLVLTAAGETMPRSPQRSKRVPVPWWRRKLTSRFSSTPSTESDVVTQYCRQKSSTERCTTPPRRVIRSPCKPPCLALASVKCSSFLSTGTRRTSLPDAWGSPIRRHARTSKAY